MFVILQVRFLYYRTIIKLVKRNAVMPILAWLLTEILSDFFQNLFDALILQYC